MDKIKLVFLGIALSFHDRVTRCKLLDVSDPRILEAMAETGDVISFNERPSPHMLPGIHISGPDRSDQPVVTLFSL